jgi:phosphate transport system substrate-binding protein
MAAVAALLASACRNVPEEARAEIRYDGATCISRKILPPLAAALHEQTGVSLGVDRSGTGTGLRRMFASEVDVAGVSRKLTAQELARKPHFQIIGYDALAVWVNDTNPVRALTKEQLKALFTGRVTSWKQLGGNVLPVVPCTEKLGSARSTVDAFQALAMDGAPYGPVKQLEDPADCLAFVASDPRGVAAATAAYALPGVHTVSIDGLDPSPANVRSGRYLLTRPLLLVTREPPPKDTALAALFELALSPQGQAAITSAGFVPAR